MAISFVASGAVANASGSGAVPLSVAVPAGVQNDDFLLMIGCRTSNATGFSTPSGWSDITQWMMDTGTNSRHSWAARRIASSEPANYSLTHSDTNAENWGAVMLAWRGVDTSTPLDQTPVGDITQNDTNDGDPPAITTQTANAWVVVFNYIRTGTGDPTAFTPPSNYTERLDFLNANINLSVADRLIAAAGAENPGVFTSGGSTNACDHILGTLALRAAAEESALLMRRRRYA